MSARRWLRRTGLALVAIGLVVCLIPVAYLLYGNWQQSQVNRQWQQEIHQAVHHPAAAVPTPGAQAPTPGAGSTPQSGSGSTPRSSSSTLPSGLLFAIRVPKIGYYAAVQQGVSSNILYVGPGHYPQTVLPGQAGTVGVAAHNTYWIKFGDLKSGDQIELQTRTQTYSYTITGTQIVQPSDVAVLDASPGQHQLVMTTCWPLWAGSLAQQRLVFFATQNGT